MEPHKYPRRSRGYPMGKVNRSVCRRRYYSRLEHTTRGCRVFNDAEGLTNRTIHFAGAVRIRYRTTRQAERATRTSIEETLTGYGNVKVVISTGVAVSQSTTTGGRCSVLMPPFASTFGSTQLKTLPKPEAAPLLQL